MQSVIDGHMPAVGTPVYAPAANDIVLSGGRLLRQAFLQAPARRAERGSPFVPADVRKPPAILIQSGVAYRALGKPDGRRAIIEILVPGDIAGADHALTGHGHAEIVAATNVAYRELGSAAVRDLLSDPLIALRLIAIMSEARRRADWQLYGLARFDARERIVWFFLEIYDRLHRRALITRPTFSLPLTQELIGDHLGMTTVHLSRSLRRLRDERLAMFNRQVVILLDMPGLRSIAQMQPPLGDLAHMPANDVLGANG